MLGSDPALVALPGPAGLIPSRVRVRVHVRVRVRGRASALQVPSLPGATQVCATPCRALLTSEPVLPVAGAGPGRRLRMHTRVCV